MDLIDLYRFNMLCMMNNSVLSSELPGLLEAWISHQKPHWSMRNSHHSLIFTIRAAFPLLVTRSPNWPSGLSPPLSLHTVPFSIKHQEICKHSGSKKAQATSLCVGHRAIHRNCTFKVPVNVRWGSEQNDWLPVSPREHYLEQKT